MVLLVLATVLIARLSEKFYDGYRQHPQPLLGVTIVPICGVYVGDMDGA